MSVRWTKDRLIEYAQTMDESIDHVEGTRRIRNRKLAFGARKLARAKQ